MKFYNLLIIYRFWLSLVAFALAIVITITSGFWPAFILYFIGALGIFSHFFIGPLRLIQEPMERGDMETVKKIIESIKYPNLLFKPIRSTYYTIKGNMAMMGKDFDSAEKYLKMSNSLGAPIPQAEGANKLQLGMMAMQKGDMKQGESYIRAAIRLGFQDKESEAVAYLNMCQIHLNKREFRAGKDFLRKAKSLHPKNKEVLDQIKQLDKYVSRVPG